MKKLNTTLIANTVGLPIKGPTLDFIQQSYQEALDALAKAVIYDATGITILFGCVNSATLPAINITAGAVYYNGEVYLVDAQSPTITGGQVGVGSIAITNPSPDPVTMTDTVSHNVHDVRKMVITSGATGSGIADFTTWKNGGGISSPWKNRSFNAGDLRLNDSSGPLLTAIGGVLNYKIIGKTMHVNVTAAGTMPASGYAFVVVLPEGVPSIKGTQYFSCLIQNTTASTSVASYGLVQANSNYFQATGVLASGNTYQIYASFSFEIN